MELGANAKSTMLTLTVAAFAEGAGNETKKPERSMTPKRAAASRVNGFNVNFTFLPLL
jgi:hypothetical protein